LTTRRKVILSIVGVITLIYLGVYSVLTPFIRGVVIDETTKQPVENAWVMATAWVGVRTIAGDGGGDHFISRPHLRTGKDGVFYIFPRLYLCIPTPYTFGNMKKGLHITVRVMDGKRAEVDLTKDWWKRVLLVSVPVEYIERTTFQISSELAGLSSYCTYGGYFFVQGDRTQRCDKWELEYVIAHHERFLKANSELRNVDQRTYFSTVLYRLALLYKRKGDLNKALQLFKTGQAFDMERGISFNQRSYSDQISEIEQILGK